MAQSPTRFFHGVSTSDGRNSALHVITTRLQVKQMTRKTHVLKLICNIYGQKKAGQVWNKYVDNGMRDIGITPSQFDPCLYYRW